MLNVVQQKKNPKMNSISKSFTNKMFLTIYLWAAIFEGKNKVKSKFLFLFLKIKFSSSELNRCACKQAYACLCTNYLRLVKTAFNVKKNFYLVNCFFFNINKNSFYIIINSQSLIKFFFSKFIDLKELNENLIKK